METNNTQQKKTYKLLTEQEYNALSDDEKKNYIPYNPSMSDKAVGIMIEQANAQLEMLSQYGPAFEKIKVLPNPLPGEQLEAIVSEVEKMETLIDPIKALSGVPIIGQLVSPLVNLINQIFKVIGSLFFLIFALAKGVDIFTDSIIETYNSIDWEGLEKTKNDLKEKKQTTGNAEEKEINWDALPTKEITNKVKETKDAIEQCYDSIQIVDSASRIYKKMCEITLISFSWKAFKDKCLKIFENLGIDFSPLSMPTDSEKKAFEKMFPDPSKASKNLSKNVNMLVQERKYISIKDNEELKAKQNKNKPKQNKS